MNIAKLVETRSVDDIISCETSCTMRDAVTILAEKRIGALPVMQDGEVVGIFSERDVIYRLANEGAVCLDRKLGDVMTSPAITTETSKKVDDALGLMTRRRIRHLPVVEKGRMCGFVSIGDLVKSRMDEVEQEAQAMREYIRT
ncbi:IMP dehydrogenase [Alteripontixanthobacter maritimus]|uniref:IMP dehydrogenase n=1 Tax=Alteripontixanthobacter maritimus TaxID=2161824 RepID=A0A369QC65_9SPHN|nr:CBS domain-containing protein [Alteripontixanthobacter maritimus]RDC61165.1 IMP dehydrogenase [Alteripontixanthobacter maritimus]